jgi:hypothetical protein
MNKQDYEDILTGPQDLTKENIILLLEYSRKEKLSVEYKQEFDRERNGKVKLLDFCKVIIGFMNSESNGSVVIYGINKSIENIENKDVSEFIEGHIINGTRPEDLVGYIRERIWPPDAWIIHIKQLVISESLAVTTIYVGKGRSKPYLYFQPNHPENGIRSFQRGSAVTYELEAPQLHQFFKQTSEQKFEPFKDTDGNKSALKSSDQILKDNFDEINKTFKDPQEFGFFSIFLKPSDTFVVTDKEIENLFDFEGNRKVNIMEELRYARNLTTSQKWYRRVLIPRALEEENKCTWAITCYRKNGFIVINGLIDEYLLGKKYLNPFYFSYQIQRALQMAKELYQKKANSLKLRIDFKYIETFGYLSLLYGRIEKIHPFVTYEEPIKKEIKFENIYSDSKSDVLIPDVTECMKEVARIFGLQNLPNSLSVPNGEMYFVQGFKGMR